MMTSSRSPSSRSMRMIKMMSAAFLIIMAVIEGYGHNWGGNSVTVTVTTFSGPFRHTYEETLYADPSKRIVNHAVVNEDPKERIIRELREEVETLQKELKEKKMGIRWNKDDGKKPVVELIEDMDISDQGVPEKAGLLLLGLMMYVMIMKSLCWCGEKWFPAFLAAGIVIIVAIFLPTSGDMSRTHNEKSHEDSHWDSHWIAPAVQIPVPSGHHLTDWHQPLSFFFHITAFILLFLFVGKISWTASSKQEEIDAETLELDAELDSLISSLARLEISQR